MEMLSILVELGNVSVVTLGKCTFGFEHDSGGIRAGGTKC